MANPSQYGGAPYLPAHLQYHAQLSANSTNSEDSIRTQVPLPYHLPQEHEQQHFGGQDFTFGGQIDDSRPTSSASSSFSIPFAPSPIYSQIGGSTLNPASPAWIPSSERQYYQDQTGMVHDSAHGVQSHFSNQGFQAQGNTQIGGAQYGNNQNNHFQGGFQGAVGPYDGFNQGQIGNVGPVQSYPVSEFDSRSSSASPMNFSNTGFHQYQQPHDMQQHFTDGSSYAGSVASGHSGFGVSAADFSGYNNSSFSSSFSNGSNGPTFSNDFNAVNQYQHQNVPMNNMFQGQFGQASGMNSGMNNMGQGQFGQVGGMSGMNMNQGQFGQVGGMAGMNVNQGQFGHGGMNPGMNHSVGGFEGGPSMGRHNGNAGQTGFGRGSNMNFGGRGRGRFGSGPSNHGSGNRSCPNSGAGFSARGRGFSRASSNSSRGSNSRSTNNSNNLQQTPMNARQQQSAQQSAQQTPPTAIKHMDNGLLDQTPRGRALANQPFASEPRFIDNGPPLRTRRNQSIANIDTGSISSWLEMTPVGLRGPSRASRPSSDSRRQSSPPKMLTNGPAFLPIAEEKSDEHSKAHVQRSVRGTMQEIGLVAAPNPAFVSTSGGIGMPKRHGMSTQLRILTNNGTTMPSAEEALMMNTLPFAETARLAKPATYGVMKITNVSITFHLV